MCIYKKKKDQISNPPAGKDEAVYPTEISGVCGKRNGTQYKNAYSSGNLQETKNGFTQRKGFNKQIEWLKEY